MMHDNSGSPPRLRTLGTRTSVGSPHIIAPEPASVHPLEASRSVQSPPKKLEEMTNAELWQLFPVILAPHNPDYTDWYEAERSGLTALPFSNDIRRISRIGSSAVKGLISKPTVDILLEIDAQSDIDSIVTDIKNAGWLVMSDMRAPELKISFNKGYTENGFADKVFHLHLRVCGDHSELYFRDYLSAHKDIADEYARLKLTLLEKYTRDRDAYTNAKTDFINIYTKKARAEFGKKYLPE